MKPIIEIVEPRLYAGMVADEIVASISDRIADSGKCTIALSGGSTPGAIYRMLSMPPRSTDIDWSKVLIFFGDERWVSHEDTQSNFHMANETLLNQLKGTKPRIFPVNTSLASPAVGAEAYEKSILSEIPGGIFDIVLLGIGEDGHTASLFPGSKLLNETTKLVASDNHPTDGTVRVTLTLPVLKKARKLFFIVKGPGKASIVKEVLEGTAGVEQFPSRFYLQAEGAVTWFLDTEASKNLRAISS